MSISDYYRTIAEFDEMRAKLRSSNLASAAQQRSINARLVAEESRRLERAGREYRALLAYCAKIAPNGEPYVFDHNGHTNGETPSSLRRKNQMRFGR